jgi:hypothetical protein
MKTKFTKLLIVLLNMLIININYANNAGKIANDLVLGGNCSIPTNPTITGSTSICSNGSSAFLASAANTDGSTTYTWSGPNGFVANNANTGTINIAGSYTCIISNGIGCSVSISETLTITSFDYVNLQFPANANICVGTNFTAFGQVFESGITEAPGAGAGIVAELGISPVNVNSDPSTWTNWTPATFNVQFFNNDEYKATVGNNLPVGTYYYTFRYALNGCNSYQYGGFGAAGNPAFWNGTSYVSGVLTVNALPTPAITGNLQFCSNASTALNTGSFSSYIWSNGAITQSTTVNAAGNYSVTVTNSNGCSAVAFANTTTIPAPMPTITGNSGICAGNAITLSTQNFVSYNWSNSSTSQSIVVSNPGNYSVIVTAANNCTASASTNVIVNAVDYANLQFPGTATICSGSNFTAYGQVFKGGLTEAAGPGAGLSVEIGISPEGSNTNPSTWTNWVPASFNVQFFNNDEFMATTGSTLTAGTYYYAFRYSLNGCSSYQYGGFGPAVGTGFWNGNNYVSGVLNVLPSPMPVITGNLSFCPGSSTLLSTGNFSTYNWSTGATSQSITINNTGNYTVVVTHPLNNCTGTANVNTSFLPVPTPNISGNLAFCAGSTSILDAGAYNAYSWSTGASTQTINVNSANNFSVVVTDANGCTGSSSVSTSVNALPAVGAIANPSLTICAGSSVTLSGTGASTYTWSGGITNGQAFTPSNAGTYTVTGTDIKGCTNNATVAITLNNCSGIPLTQLTAADCNRINVLLNGTVGCTAVSGATNYDFELTNTSNNVVSVKTTSGTALALSSVTPVLQFSTTYNIRVRAKVGGVYGIYGQSCSITTICNPAICAIPNTKLRTVDCGKLNFSLTSSIIADAVSGANQYEFEFRNPVSNALVATKLQSSNVLLLSAVTPNLQWSTQYNVGVRAYIAGVAGNYGTICLIGLAADPAIAGVPTTKLNNTNCGKLNLALTSSIACDPVNNATAYEWEFKDAINTNVIAIVSTSTTSLNLSTVNSLQWATQYNVRVRATVSGVQGIYGLSCLIGFITDPAIGGVPATKLRTSDCGKLNFGLSGSAVADAVSGANQYEFEISDAANTTILNTISQATNTLNFSTVPLLQWGTQYNIKVRARIGSTWGNFGAACLIGFICDPSICGTPVAKLRNIDCGKLNFLLSSGYMVADAVSGASLYEFEIKNLTTNNIITQQRTTTTIFFNSIVPALQSNTQYSVRVRATIAGVTGVYGAACTIGFVSGSRETELILDEKSEEEFLNNESVFVAYPNPFSSLLNLSISNIKDMQIMQYSLFDAAGRLVLNNYFNLNAGNNNIEINLSDLESGFYNLVMTSKAGEYKTIRVVKQ